MHLTPVIPPQPPPQAIDANVRDPAAATPIGLRELGVQQVFCPSTDPGLSYAPHPRGPPPLPPFQAIDANVWDPAAANPIDLRELGVQQVFGPPTDPGFYHNASWVPPPSPYEPATLAELYHQMFDDDEDDIAFTNRLAEQLEKEEMGEAGKEFANLLAEQLAQEEGRDAGKRRKRQDEKQEEPVAVQRRRALMVAGAPYDELGDGASHGAMGPVRRLQTKRRRPETPREQQQQERQGRQEQAQPQQGTPQEALTPAAQQQQQQQTQQTAPAAAAAAAQEQVEPQQRAQQEPSAAVAQQQQDQEPKVAPEQQPAQQGKESKQQQTKDHQEQQQQAPQGARGGGPIDGRGGGANTTRPYGEQKAPGPAKRPWLCWPACILPYLLCRCLAASLH